MKKINQFLDSLYFMKEDMKKTNEELLKKRNDSSKKRKYKFRFKTDVKRDVYFILVIAFIGTLLIFFNNMINKPINFNANKTKEIVLLNYINDDGAKAIRVTEREDIEKVVDALNQLRKSKDTKNNLEIDDVFGTNSISNESDKIIFIVKGKNKNQIVELYSDYLVKKGKTIYIENNTCDTLWYLLNYNIEDVSKNELEELLSK